MSKGKAKRIQAEQNACTARALDVLSSPHLFPRYLDLIQKSGLVGEKRNAAILTIVAISRLLESPLSVLIKGASSSGKNFLAKRSLSPLPRDAVRELTSSTTAAWSYSEDDFRHRVVLLQERNEASGAVHPVRLLISEGKLIRTISAYENGIRKSKSFLARGPVAAISTTTQNQLEIDDESRHLSIWIDESPQQTKRIVLANCIHNPGVSKEELRIWRTAHRLIAKRAASCQIVQPKWFREIAKSVYTKDVRVRRYFPAFVTACKAIALLRSFQRESERGAHEKIHRV